MTEMKLKQDLFQVIRNEFSSWVATGLSGSDELRLPWQWQHQLRMRLGN